MAGGIESVLVVCSSCTTARQCARSGVCEREIAAWLRHIDTLTKVRRVATILPGTNPLWDAGELLEREFASSEALSPESGENDRG